MQKNSQIDFEIQSKKLTPIEYFKILSQMNDIYEQVKYSQADFVYRDIIHECKTGTITCQKT
jgi:hypothetical protein